MNIQIEPVMPEQKDVFAQMMNLYDYDFTEYTNADIKESGYYYAQRKMGSLPNAE